MVLCPVTFTILDRSTFAFFNLLTTVLRALWLVNFLSLLSRIVFATMLFIISFILFSPIGCTLNQTLSSGFLCFDGEVKWTSRLQVLWLATHKLLKKSHWTSFTTNGKHSWLKIAVLCVQASLSGFGLPFSELTYKLHAIVVFAKLEVIHFHVVMFLPAAEPKMLGK